MWGPLCLFWRFIRKICFKRSLVELISAKQGIYFENLQWFVMMIESDRETCFSLTFSRIFLALTILTSKIYIYTHMIWRKFNIYSTFTILFTTYFQHTDSFVILFTLYLYILLNNRCLFLFSWIIFIIIFLLRLGITTINCIKTRKLH